MKKVFYSLFILIMLFVITGCGAISSCQVDGETLHFNQQYRDYYITYNYPDEFKQVELDEYSAYQNQEFELYNNNNQKILNLRVEQHSLILSFTPMNEDAQKLENDTNHKGVEQQVIKVNGKNMVRYSYRMKDEFGENTLYYVYYGGYSYMGVNEYIKIIMSNMDGKADFEKAFLSSFRINN